MPTYPALPPLNFLGLPPESSGFEGSAALVLPIPYEATVSYGGGAKSGPSAILEASGQVELYDADLGFEPASRWGIHTLPALAPEFSGPGAMVAAIDFCCSQLLPTGKLLVGLGGEHTVSVGIAQSVKRTVGDFVTVQLDAHADLRDSYDGTPYSHACAARRILDIGTTVVQLGTRSWDASEAEFLRSNPDRVISFPATQMRRDRSYLEQLAEKITGRNVFLTLDLDVFDPAFMPATGTPEPGGLDWYDVLEIVQTVAAHSRVIAFDCVELAPIPALHAPNFLAAKLVYKTIGVILDARERLQ